MGAIKRAGVLDHSQSSAIKFAHGGVIGKRGTGAAGHHPLWPGDDSPDGAVYNAGVDGFGLERSGISGLVVQDKLNHKQGSSIRIFFEPRINTNVHE